MIICIVVNIDNTSQKNSNNVQDMLIVQLFVASENMFVI